MNIFILCNVFFFFPEMLLCILNNFNGYISIPHSDLLSTCSDILSFCFKPNYFMKRFLNTIKNLLFSLQRFFFLSCLLFSTLNFDERRSTLFSIWCRFFLHRTPSMWNRSRFFFPYGLLVIALHYWHQIFIQKTTTSQSNLVLRSDEARHDVMRKPIIKESEIYWI